MDDNKIAKLMGLFFDKFNRCFSIKLHKALLHTLNTTPSDAVPRTVMIYEGLQVELEICRPEDGFHQLCMCIDGRWFSDELPESIDRTVSETAWLVSTKMRVNYRRGEALDNARSRYVQERVCRAESDEIGACIAIPQEEPERRGKSRL